MEDIVLAVVPVWISGVVRAGPLDGLDSFNDICLPWLGSEALLAFIFSFVRRAQIHLVRVNDLAFFL